jgi:hypothetical protein
MRIINNIKSLLKIQKMNDVSIISNKKILEKAIKHSLEKAIEEIHVANPDFSEEALRYIVMSELSNFSIFGTFPNTNSKTKLVFEKKYNRLKRKKTSTYRPDISSINENANLLAIELKIAKPSSSNHLYDITKCKEYIDLNKGKCSYELAASIYAPPHYENWHDYLHQSLDFTLKSAKSQGKNIENSQILIGYIKWESRLIGRPKAEVITGWI